MRQPLTASSHFLESGLVSDVLRSMADMFGRHAALSTEEGASRRDWSPPVDVYETDTEVVVKAELPGIKKEDIAVTATEQSLTLAGESQEESEVTAEGFVRRERCWGRFERTVELPVPVQSDQAGAKFEDGVLEVRMPKAQQGERKTIPVE